MQEVSKQKNDTYMVLLQAVQVVHVIHFFVFECLFDHVDQCCDLHLVLEELIVHKGL